MKEQFPSKLPLPKVGIEGLKENWHSDLIAGYRYTLAAIVIASGLPFLLSRLLLF